MRQAAQSDGACEAARQLRRLGGALGALQQLDALLRARGASDFLFAGLLLGIAPTADGQLQQPVRTHPLSLDSFAKQYIAHAQCQIAPAPAPVRGLFL
jgi:hypothetical protein